MFVNFFLAFDFIHRGKMEQTLLVYGLSNETATAIMILYMNTKVKIRSPDRDRFLHDYCWISTRRYISTISVHNLPRLCTSNIERSN